MVMKSVIEISTMQDKDGEDWSVRLELDGTNQPIVSIAKQSGPKHTYLASTFVGLGGRCNGFRISPLWDDECYIEFSNSQWLPACIAVRNAIPISAGELDVRWIPDDPNLPF
jgi:hypothetical protein